jgi:4-hydroxybenzoyl-CoA thioesterase
MLTNQRTFRIEWGDCDPAHIVYFPRYLAYFDNCTAALFEAAGFPKPLLLKQFDIVGIPLVDVRATFLIPSTFGDEVTVMSCISEWGRSSFKVKHQLMKGESLAVEGWETRVWTCRDASRPGGIASRPIPRELIASFGGPDWTPV